VLFYPSRTVSTLFLVPAQEAPRFKRHFVYTILRNLDLSPSAPLITGSEYTHHGSSTSCTALQYFWLEWFRCNAVLILVGRLTKLGMWLCFGSSIVCQGDPGPLFRDPRLSPSLKKIYRPRAIFNIPGPPCPMWSSVFVSIDLLISTIRDGESKGIARIRVGLVPLGRRINDPLIVDTH